MLSQAHTPKCTTCIFAFMLHKFYQYKQMRSKFLTVQARKQSEISKQQHSFTQSLKHFYRNLQHTCTR